MQPLFRRGIPVQQIHVSFLCSVRDKKIHTIIFDGLIFDGLIFNGLVFNGLVFNGLNTNWDLANIGSSRNAA